jgi:hypothetical protein
MTLAAMRLFLGPSKGWEESLLREAGGLVGLVDPGGFDVFEDELGQGLFWEDAGGPRLLRRP